MLTHHLAGQVGRRGADPQRTRGLGPAHVEVAVSEPDLLAQFLRTLDRERKGRGIAQHLDGIGDDLDLTGRQVRVLVARLPQADPPGDLDAVLRAQVVRGAAAVRIGVSDHDLRDARGVTQVDEDHAAVVAAVRHPAGQRHLLADLLRPERSRLMSADHECISLRLLHEPLLHEP